MLKLKYPKLKTLDLVFSAYLILVLLVIFGYLPRGVVPYLVLVVCIYVLKAPLEDGVVFFVRSIPFFIAIPLTLHFDSFNAWRVISILIFLRWFIQPLRAGAGLNLEHFKTFFDFNKKRKVYLTSLLLLVLAVLSVGVAASYTLAIKRVIYFVNLSLIATVIYDLAFKNSALRVRLIKNIAVPVIIVALLGLLQTAMTYFVDIYQFMRIWGEGIELRLFGREWSDIAIRGNTWFAYFGEQLSLRVFSIFPDSHSFPIFLLLGLPSIFAIAVTKVADGAHLGLKTMLKTRGRLFVLFVPLIFLMAILSGTRGIWAGVLGVLLAYGFWHIVLKRNRVKKERINILKYLASYMALFFLLFSIALPIFASPQFLVSKGDLGILGNRFRSIVDAGETSNRRRIEIWTASLRSMVRKPFLGVGIGNFPVVVGEPLQKADAGGTAHNVYLNIGAEMGIPALLAALYFLFLLLKKTYENFRRSQDNFLTVYYSAVLLFIPWVLLYLLTDAALFDERAFLLFVTVCALIFSHHSTGLGQEKKPEVG